MTQRYDDSEPRDWIDTSPAQVIYIGDLSPRHQAALRLFVTKFKLGALEHGDLQEEKEWTEDMIGENVDFLFYLLFQLLKIRKVDGGF